MARKGYITISIPEELITEVDKIVKTRKKGFVSRSDFIKNAIRNELKNT